MENKQIKSFEDLIVWQKADLMWQMTCDDILNFPNNRIGWVLSDQLLRSIGSISANIAEGYGSGYPNEFRHSLRISRKECTEAINWLIKSERLNYITKQRLIEYKNLATEIYKMINSLLSKIKAK